MYRVEKTETFESWLDGLRDRRARARARIAQRLLRVEEGLLGDFRSLGDGVSELRIDYGPGYRLYFTIRGKVVIILLCGSNKRDQRAAIRAAKDMAREA